MTKLEILLPYKTVDMVLFGKCVEDIQRKHTNELSVDIIYVLTMLNRRLTNER